jgi:predicted transcriptional regulator
LRRREHVLDNMTTYFLRTVLVDVSISIVPYIIETSRRFVKVEVQIVQDGEVISKAMLTVQTIDPS